MFAISDIYSEYAKLIYSDDLRWSLHLDYGPTAPTDQLLTRVDITSHQSIADKLLLSDGRAFKECSI